MSLILALLQHNRLSNPNQKSIPISATHDNYPGFTSLILGRDKCWQETIICIFYCSRSYGEPLRIRLRVLQF